MFVMARVIKLRDKSARQDAAVLEVMLPPPVIQLLQRLGPNNSGREFFYTPTNQPAPAAARYAVAPGATEALMEGLSLPHPVNDTA